MEQSFTAAQHDVAAAILKPRTTVEVSTAVGLCVRRGINIIAQGANTGLVGGSTPDETGADIAFGLFRPCDRELKMMRTVPNITGGLVVGVTVVELENELIREASSSTYSR